MNGGPAQSQRHVFATGEKFLQTGFSKARTASYHKKRNRHAEITDDDSCTRSAQATRAAAPR